MRASEEQIFRFIKYVDSAQYLQETRLYEAAESSGTKTLNFEADKSLTSILSVPKLQRKNHGSSPKDDHFRFRKDETSATKETNRRHGRGSFLSKFQGKNIWKNCNREEFTLIVIS